MTDSPQLIGRHRVQPQALGLGLAVPLTVRRPFDDTAAPVDVVGPPKTADELRADSEERRDQQPMSTVCGFCDWRFEGTAGTCRDAAATHRAAEHPDATNRLGRRRRASGNWRRDENADAERAEANRVRAEREDAERLAKIERGRHRDALAAMDAGERQEPDPELEEASAASGAGPSGTSAGVSSSPADPRQGRHTMHENGRTSPASDRWDREAIIEAIQAIAVETGFVPAQRDFNGPSTDTRPNLALIKRAFGSFGSAVEQAGYPRTRRGGLPFAVARDSGREPQAAAERPTHEEVTASTPPALPGREEPSRPEEPAQPTHDELAVDDEEQPPSDFAASDEAKKPEAALSSIHLRNPIRTAAIPYDAEILDDEADFLIRRAAALRQIASAIRVLAEPRELAA